MAEPHGRYVALSVPRRFVGDLVHFARKVPLIVAQRRLELGPLAKARESCDPRPSWPALFIKAYSLVAANHAKLRRAYLPFPWPHLYEHPRSVAAVAVERLYDAEHGVFFAVLGNIEGKRLRLITRLLRQHKEKPLARCGNFRRIVRVSRLPRPFRRMVWWLSLNLSGWFRARYLGTFGLTVVSGMGTALESFLCPLTTALTYDTFLPDGSVDVRLAFDHRVLDGGTAARVLADLETTLLGPILEEVCSNPPQSRRDPYDQHETWSRGAAAIVSDRASGGSS